MGIQLNIRENTPELLTVDLVRNPFTPGSLLFSAAVFAFAGAVFYLVFENPLPGLTGSGTLLRTTLPAVPLLIALLWLFRHKTVKTVSLTPAVIEVVNPQKKVVQSIAIADIVSCTATQAGFFGGVYIFDMRGGTRETFQAIFGLYLLLKDEFAKRYRFHITYKNEKTL